MTTKAWLEGHLFDLAALADLLAVGDVRVVRDDGDDENRYYLTAPEIDNPSEPGRFDQPAELLVGRINGLARTRDASYRPVSLSGIYTSPNGQHVFARAAIMEIRANSSVRFVVTGPDGKPVPDPPSPWPDRFALAATIPEVAEVLEIMGRAEPLGWVDLYKVHEIIRDRNQAAQDPRSRLGYQSRRFGLHGVNQPRRCERSGSTPRAQFRCTANTHNVAG